MYILWIAATKSQKKLQQLINGEFFMRPASYYHHLENGQGDQAEGALIHSVAIYKNTQYAIYCLYAVDNKDIDADGSIYIPKKCIEDFHCENGFGVIIDYEKFEKLLPLIQTEGYQLWAGRVCYRKLIYEDMPDMMDMESLDNLFTKRPYFAYQREYRIVIPKNVPEEKDSVYYKSEFTLDSIANIVSISSLNECNGKFIISKTDINV